jgi:DNA-directed RNA polymerase subunit alpha
VQIVSSIGKSYSNYRELREAAAELEEQPNRSPATSARLGVCLYLLGRYTDAVETLSHSDGGALTHFYLGKAFLALDKYADALTAYESADKAGYSPCSAR